jgi:cytochrome b561
MSTMQVEDASDGYGWISIALHWVTAVVVVTLLFVGSSISSLMGDERHAMVRLHTSIAISSYAVLWLRIWWRFDRGHPAATAKQRGPFFHIGKYVHFALLVAIAVMLVSGPLMVWFGGSEIEVFGWFSIPSPVEARMGWHDLFFTVHRTAAITIVTGLVLHLGGVYKHAAFNRDGTFTKMMVASGTGTASDSRGRAG